MTIQQFLARVLPEAGIYCFSTKTRHGAFINESCATLEELAERSLAVAPTKDVWYATATYSRLLEYHPKRKEHVFRRTQDNSTELRALWLDLDGFDTTRQAVAALIEFITASKLPAPLVVSSGYGLHVYWPLETAVDKVTWESMAQKLRAICLGLEFKVDHSGTTDSARVLRAPQTINHKYGSQREVKVLAEGVVTSAENLDKLLDAAVAPYTDLIARPRRAAGKVLYKPEDVDNPLLSSMLIVPEEVLEDQRRVPGPIVRGCQQIREAGSQSEPTWHRMISVMKLCRNADKAIHILSKVDNARYCELDTDNKIAQSQAIPVTCEEFNVQRPGVCDSCQHRYIIKSPIQLGVPEVKQVERPTSTAIAELELPEGSLWDSPSESLATLKTFEPVGWRGSNFRIDERGTWALKRDGEYESDILMTANIFRPISICRNKDGVQVALLSMRGAREGSVEEQVEIPLEDIHDPRVVVSAFGAKGMMLANGAPNPKMFTDFIRGYMDFARGNRLLMENKEYSRLGWGDEDEYVLGDKVVHPDGTIVDTPGMNLQGWERDCVQEGSLPEWVSAANHMFTPADQARQAIMFLHGFSAPLVRYFPQTETTFTFVVGRSGIGKSTLASLMHSIWFKPFAFPKGAGDYRSKAGATMNSLYRTAGVLHSMPFYIDEATLWDDRDAASYVYDISSGLEKKRLTSSSQQMYAGEWRTTAMATANESLRGKLMNSVTDCAPLLYRIIEFELPERDYGGVYEGSIEAMQSNFGSAGLQYARFLTKNAASGRLKEMLDYYGDMLQVRFKFTQAERYWKTWTICMVTGMELSRAAGLHNIDSEVIISEMERIIGEQRMGIKDVANVAKDWLGEFLSDLWPDTIVTQLSQGRMTVSGDLEEFLTDGKPVRGVKVRSNASTGVIEMSVRAVSEWCRHRNIRVADFEAELRAKGRSDPSFEFAGKVRIRLGQGIPLLSAVTGQVVCYRIIQDPSKLREDLYRVEKNHDSNRSI